MLLVLAAFLAAPPPPPPAAVAAILARVAEEADALQENITNTVTEETFTQRAILPPSRFKPRGVPRGTVSLRYQVRQIVSEYTVGTLKETGSKDLHEFRQVVSVDGRQIQSPGTARHALSLGLRSEDDRIRKRMLEDFAKYGLVDIATDYGLILLEFTKRGLSNLAIQAGQTANIGADPAVALLWKQKSDAGGETQFTGRRVVREPLSGVLWVRESDSLPLRIEVWADYTNDRHTTRDWATVDYVPSSHGFLTPASVLHRHLIDGQVITENSYRYQPFKIFSSDADIKFTELPDQPPPDTPKPPVKK
jgi:hypothetical protein